MTLTWHLRPLLLSTQVGLLSAPGKLSWQRSNRFCELVPLNAHLVRAAFPDDMPTFEDFSSPEAEMAEARPR